MFDKWLDSFCRLVCINNAAYRAMWGEWRKRLEPFSRDDLDRAAEWFVVSWYPLHPDAQWGSHPGAVFGKLRELFAERQRKEANKEYQKSLTFAQEGRLSMVQNAMKGIGVEKIKEQP